MSAPASMRSICAPGSSVADKKLYRTVVRADLPNLTKPLAIVPPDKSRTSGARTKTAVI